MPSRVSLRADQRSFIAKQFDPAAVEEIANLLPEDERRFFLAPFGGVPGEVSSAWSVRDTYYLTRHDDPRVQALLEQMWAPFWETSLHPEALDDPAYDFPGRELARARRAENAKG